MYIVIAIRGLDIEFRWNGSYFVGTREKLSEAIELAKEERNIKSNYKYGCIVYCYTPDSTEVYKLYTGHDDGVLNEAYQHLLIK